MAILLPLLYLVNKYYIVNFELGQPLVRRRLGAGSSL